MTRLSPSGEAAISVPSLGALKGFTYPSGVRQFFGVPYGNISKRWTRAQLVTSWKDNFHDGTRLGKHYPLPPEYDPKKDYLVPVTETEHFSPWEANDLECLNLNIALPPADLPGPHPVMVYIHGGAFFLAGPQHPVFDCARLVTTSVERRTPVVTVTIGYRVGLGGFLASREIQQDLARDNHSGAGNFGLTDQQIALHWVQKYIGLFGGDANNVTLFGESAGAISISHHLLAAEPPKFDRAILMSGTLNLAPAWPLEKHQRRYDELLRFLNIDPAAPDTLDQLRRVSQDALTAATWSIEHADFPIYNPCYDGVFHRADPLLLRVAPLPPWLKGFMAGDTRDEGLLWRLVLRKYTYTHFHTRMGRFLTPAETAKILALYNITAESESNSPDAFFQGLEALIRDVLFVIPNYIHFHEPEASPSPSAKPKPRIPMFAYHVDQQSTLANPLKGTAYHAIDLLYVFQNGDDMSAEQQALARQMGGDFIDFAYGRDPYKRVDAGGAMVYGPESKAVWKTEEADESVRGYARMKSILEDGLYQRLFAAVDDIGGERHRFMNR
ncbi:uncharacterized protein DSM5745_08016 [Aspergillus mulundensis]|uniref:Carboxylic ester hydrolase n=1 Tax=Aspergillus mulundensis TaxID=1810919 RepID=A0A3D8R905_9EURO|nr:hypothetical protein DSM5745_08016 [Aspergillus mulundensis]RDW70505.1 hypothetical protein DSM5745_08016 [Aspergillus mulundensis]